MSGQDPNNDMYYQKYLKYKQKYLALKAQMGGVRVLRSKYCGKAVKGDTVTGVMVGIDTPMNKLSGCKRSGIFTTYDKNCHFKCMTDKNQYYQI